MFKKSLYIFLTALLGVLLFLMLHRIWVFFYLYLLAGNYITTSLNYYQFLVLDYTTLLMAMVLGAWYGIWLGMYWFRKVYEEGSHGGFIQHINTRYYGAAPKKLETKMVQVRQKLENDLWQLEDLAKESLAQVKRPQAIKRAVARKRAPRKAKAVK